MDELIIKSDLIVPKIKQKSVIDLLIDRLSIDSYKTCIIDCTLDRKWTKQEVLDSSLNFAYYLSIDLNIRKGDVVCIASNNSDIHAIAFIGVLAAGAVYCSLQEDCSEFEINGIITKTKPSLMICTNSNYEIIENMAKTKPFIKKILLIERESKIQMNSNESSVEEIIRRTRNYNYDLPIRTGLNDLATFVMTSGSTGQPKVILRTNGNQLAMTESLQHQEFYGSDPNAIQLATGICHISGQMIIMNSISCGSTIAVIRDDIDPELVFEAINRYQISNAFLTPTRLNFISKNYQKFNKNYLNNLRNIATGGAPISESTYKTFSHEFEFIKLRNCFGMSEVGWGTQVPISESKTITNCLTIGKVCPNVEMKIIDESGHSLPANMTGELCIRSPMVTPGYLDNEEANSKLFTGDGFLRSGDIGYYDENHYFYIIGRIKDTIIVGTTNVMPTELEGILMLHNDVVNAAVFGIQHKEFNEVPFAFVTLIEGSNVSEQTLIDFVDSRVNYYKKLRGGLKILESFPLTPLKKINKKELKKMIV